MRQPIRLRLAALSILVLSLSLVLSMAASDTAVAQLAVADGPAGEREQQFAQLARDVDALSRELGIYKRVAKLVSPSVVHVEATPLPQYRFRRDIEEAGSAVLVRFRGSDYVLTNRHVIKHSQEDLIRLELHDGRQLQPKQIWSDTETDVAVMRVDSDNLVPARIGDSDTAEIGEIVMAFGSPFNLRRSVTRGIISAKGRSNLDLGEGEVVYQKFLQTDAAINPGNSGGPLVNLRGEVIGLNTAIASNSGGNEGIGFSIPINIAVQIMRQLIETGKVEDGFIGVELDLKFDSAAARLVGLSELRGARITGFTENSPAPSYDIRKNDVILSFDGLQIQNKQHLINLVKRTEIGRQVKIVIFRDRQMLTKFVRIGRRSDYLPSR
ncbi:MAG: trypsin-like peptidase domain-containing protein [Planctomycetota bacterium]